MRSPSLLDHVANVDADAKFDAPLGREAGVVAGALDDPAMVGRDGRIDEIAGQAPDAREGSLLVGAGEAAVSDDAGDQNRCELPGPAHAASTAGTQLAARIAAVSWKENTMTDTAGGASTSGESMGRAVHSKPTPVRLQDRDNPAV
jgi:hypothetical protein